MNTLSAKQMVKQNPASAIELASKFRAASKAEKPILYCVVIGSALGNSEFIPLETVNQASQAYRAFIDENWLGSRDAGSCLIYHKGKVVGYVSYNGKVWEGKPQAWNKDQKPIYDPANA